MNDLDLTLVQAKAAGYCITSRRAKYAKRIDRKDWREYMAKEHAPWDPTGQEGMSWVKSMGDSLAADHYRRCYSNDQITVTEEWFKILKNSNNGPTEFRHKPYHLNTEKVQQEILIDYLTYGSYNNSFNTHGSMLDTLAKFLWQS